MEDRRALRAKRVEQIGDPRHRVRIVAPLAGGLPFVKGALHVDDDKGGGGSVGHDDRFRTCAGIMSWGGWFRNAAFPSFSAAGVFVGRNSEAYCAASRARRITLR